MKHQYVKLKTKAAVDRIPASKIGMVFKVDSFSNGVGGQVAHVKDSRFYQIWSLPVGSYEVITEEEANEA